MVGPIRVAVADDHALIRQALAVLLRAEGIVVVGEAGCADEAHSLAEAGCDVLLLDLRMDRNTLVDIAELSRKTRVLVLTASEQPGDALAAMRAGASGYVCKRAGATQLVQAIRAIAAGEVKTPPELRGRSPETGPHPTWPALTRRESEIVREVTRGLRSAEVARQLAISEATVKTHLSNVFEKLGVRDRAELTLYAVKNGLLSPGDEPTN